MGSVSPHQCLLAALGICLADIPSRARFLLVYRLDTTRDRESGLTRAFDLRVTPDLFSRVWA